MRSGAVLALLLASSVATASPRWRTDERTPAPRSIADPARAEEAARGELGRLAPGVDARDFLLIANHVDRGLRTVTFQQTARGLPVLRATVGVVFSHDRILATYSSAVPDLSNRVSRVATGDAIVGDRVARLSIEPEARVYRDAITGAELARIPTVMHATATLAYNVGVRYGTGARTNVPAPDATITVDGSSRTTDATGVFTWPGMTVASVLPGRTGTYVRVLDTANGALPTLSAAPDATVVWDASADEETDAVASTYIYANIAKARARIVNPAVASWLDTALDFRVNGAGECNAFATATSVNLFAGSALCDNTGRVGDIVFHEFGHTFHANSVIPGMGDFESNLSEGLADFFAANITNDPGMGRGLYRDDEPLRDIDPAGLDRVFPDDFDFDTHVSGLIIAETLWDLRAAIGVPATERIFTGILQRAPDIASTYTAAQIADDDDGDLTNGTPHGCALERAFGRHGLVPGFVDTTVGIPVIADRAITVTTTTPAGAACPPRTVSSMKILWRAGEAMEPDLALTASGATWSGEFPVVPDGTVVHYLLEVTFDDGSTQRLPNNPADPMYERYVGDVTPIWCESFDADPAWTQSASPMGTDWQWGSPPSADVQRDPRTAHTGTNIFGTRLDGAGNYRDGATTEVETPVFRIPAYEHVRLQYWRWLTIEDGRYDTARIAANDTEIWHNVIDRSAIFDHVDREWRFHDLDLTDVAADGRVQLRWSLAADETKSLGGWNIDDVCIVGVNKRASCGDGVIDVGEQCDDGNRDNDDGCTASCTDEIASGGGGGCDAGGGGSGWLLALALATLGVRRRRRCPRGHWVLPW